MPSKLDEASDATAAAERPLFTLRGSAAYLGVPAATIHRWARPRTDGPLITVLPRAGRSATVPFVGFVEAFVLSALRSAGVPMQGIRPAVERLAGDVGVGHGLASERVYTDGAELIFDDAAGSNEPSLMAVVRTGQQHFSDVIRGYLSRITYGTDGWVEQLRLPVYENAEVIVSTRGRRSASRSSFTAARRSKTSLIASRPGTASARSPRTSNVPPVEVEDVIRVAVSNAAGASRR